MEIVKKVIHLEPHISRHCSLIPYVSQTNEVDGETSISYGNWGKYPYDIDINRCENMTHPFRHEIIYPQVLLAYFKTNRVSFSVLSNKFYVLKNIIDNAVYYQLIKKNNTNKWVEFNPTFVEKFNIEITTDFPSENGDVNYIGIYSDNSFVENGGHDMFFFLLKAMGIFVVDNSYISDNNGVPDIMYYAGINAYLDSMEKFKNSENCCKMKEYAFMGDDMFYFYLKYKLSEKEEEAVYWKNALFRDENGEIPSPFMTMDIAMTCDANNIGNYTVTETPSETKTSNTNSIIYHREVTMESNLKYLRRKKISYCEEWDGKEFKTKELPFILDEIGDGTSYKLTQPYQVGYSKNLHSVNSYTYFGDMIYRMDFREDEGVVDIYYVLGGEMRDDNGLLVYVDNDTTADDRIELEDFMNSPASYDNLSADNYLYLKNELKKEVYKNDKIKFKGVISSESSIITFRNENTLNEVWVYQIGYCGNFKGNECHYGDYVFYYGNIISQFFIFNTDIINRKKFSGIKCYEQKTWKWYNYKENSWKHKINMLFEDSLTSSSNLFETDYIINAKKTQMIDFANMNNDVCGVFSIWEETEDMLNNCLIMRDYDVGKIDVAVKNNDDIQIDRGFVTSFELHYKLGEIHTMEDMENYGNNFFGF